MSPEDSSLPRQDLRPVNPGPVLAISILFQELIAVCRKILSRIWNARVQPSILWYSGCSLQSRTSSHLPSQALPFLSMLPLDHFLGLGSSSSVPSDLEVTPGPWGPVWQCEASLLSYGSLSLVLVLSFPGCLDLNSLSAPKPPAPRHHITICKNS